VIIPVLIGSDWLIAAICHKQPTRMAVFVYVLSSLIASLGFFLVIERTVFA
jgi:hypothetical protein